MVAPASAPRILFLTATCPCWSETFIAQELRLFRDAGLNLFPVAIYPGPAAEKEPGVTFLSRTPARAAGQGGQKKRTVVPAVQRQFSLWRHRQELAALIDLAREQRVDWLYAATGDLPALLVWAAATRLDLPYSVSLHARDALVNKFGDIPVLSGAQQVFTCNAGVHSLLAQRTPELLARLHLVPHGLILEEWPRIKEVRPSSAQLRLGFIGRLVEKKRADLALRACGRLRKKQACTLLVAGDGPERQRLECLTEELQIKDAVRFLGVLSRNQIRLLLQQDIDCLLVPSGQTADGDREGIPNVVLEAMATGIPVIAAPTGGIPEVLTPQTGWPLPESEWPDLSSVLTSIRQNPKTLTSILAHARTLVETRFNAHHLIRERLHLLTK